MKKKILRKTTEIIDGKSVTVTILSPKERKVTRYVDRSNTTCPNCQSTLRLNDLGQYECTSNKLMVWEKEFFAYDRADMEGKEEILAKFSNTSLFSELYDRWKYARENDEKFDCGYTNEVFPLLSESKEVIPDPLVVKRVEKKLGRELTLDELLGEVELFTFGGRVLTEWRPKARTLRIPWIVLPSQSEVKV
jgi:hypothetical protein